jgi:enoyl-CoA hydratase
VEEEMDYPDYRFLTAEKLDDGRIVRLMLNRPETRNAMNRGLVMELDDAFLKAEADDDCRVVILGGNGPVFSSGHDIGSKVALAERPGGDNPHRTYNGFGGGKQSLEHRFRQEWHFFLQNTLRWRNLRKITICQVQGPAYIAAAMTAWACDLICAAENATFADPAATRFGDDHGEYFAHPWELGIRRAKELLLTGEAIDAEEARRIGMVSKVFPTEQLTQLTYEFAKKISKLPSATSLIIKEACNHTQDIQGFTNSLETGFYLHMMMHSHWAELHDDKTPTAKPEDGIEGLVEGPAGSRGWPPVLVNNYREP